MERNAHCARDRTDRRTDKDMPSGKVALRLPVESRANHSEVEQRSRDRACGHAYNGVPRERARGNKGIEWPEAEQPDD
jgi:hypothetical protein